MFDQPEVTFADAIRHNAAFCGRAPAVIAGDRRLTWREFHARTNRVANALLAAGLAKGDRVCLVMDNSITAYELVWGVIKAGGVISPLSTMVTPDAWAVMIGNARPRLVFAGEAYTAALRGPRRDLGRTATRWFTTGPPRDGWEAADDLVATGSDGEVPVRVAASDSMVIMYSSGTTGEPKGAETSHRARLVYPFGCGLMLKMDRDSVALCATPIYTNGTWITMLAAVYLGATVVLLEKYGAEAFLAAVAGHRVTHAFLVPTQTIGILAHERPAGHDTSSLRVLLTGGAPMPAATFELLERTFPAVGVHEIYGVSEGWITMALPQDRSRREGTVGKPVFGADVKAIDPAGAEVPAGEIGELVGWGPSLMKGYHGRPDLTEAAMWLAPDGRTYLRSGDLGRIDEDGFVFVSGRVKDMIISGGVNVFAADIEDVYAGHPDVREAVCVGIPHEKWGETPLLFVILAEGATATPAELKSWGDERLGRYQRVSRVEVVDDLPRTNYGKVLKRELRAPYWEGHERDL